LFHFFSVLLLFLLFDVLVVRVRRGRRGAPPPNTKKLYEALRLLTVRKRSRIPCIRL
jgi:hypothetical protein